MPSKTEEYLALAQRTANGLTRYWESWTAYLTTASRLYKYRFEDQLMIYAQRPDATAYIKTVSNIGYQFVPSSESVRLNRNL